jgi:hypothetical protein
MSTATTARSSKTTVRYLRTESLDFNAFSIGIYGDPEGDSIADLMESIRAEGILMPLVVVCGDEGWELISGHRRLECARRLGLREVPCLVQILTSQGARQRAVLEYNRQRQKTFSQVMREADALEHLALAAARERSRANLRQGQKPFTQPDGRSSDTRGGRTDSTIARALGMGGKDLYRQARAVWCAAETGDPRARSAVVLLDAGSKTVHAAYKDLRRRDRFTIGFRPTPYDVWAFRHDRAFGVPHPGAIPAGIIAHTVHYFTAPGGLVVDPMSGGGTTLDVCHSMGRRCLAYDLDPARPDIRKLDVRQGLPPEAHGCDLLFCDPPYHTMLARRFATEGVEHAPLSEWLDFLRALATHAFAALRPGGLIALLLACQTEKDLPAGIGYIDHAFHGYAALTAAGFVPERRVSCPMSGSYLPQDVIRARREGRLLGQVRDLVVMRRPA